jgi:hypothetical protein
MEVTNWDNLTQIKQYYKFGLKEEGFEDIKWMELLKKCSIVPLLCLSAVSSLFLSFFPSYLYPHNVSCECLLKVNGVQ